MKQVIRSIILFCLAAGTAVMFQGCNKLKDAVKADVTLTSDMTFDIPVIPSPGSASLATQGIYMNVDSTIRAANSQLSADNIKSVKLKSFRLEMQNGDNGNNFANLSACTVAFNSTAKSDFVTLAEITDNPDVTAYTLDLPVNSSVDLKDYFNSSYFTYRLSATARRATTKELTVKATIQYTVTAGL
ncbi:hypothetical protein ACTHGU_14090 [Chitinophagaceae bacterium MMS25-I14]